MGKILNYLKNKLSYSFIYAALKSIFLAPSAPMFIGFIISALVSIMISDGITQLIPVDQIINSLYGQVREIVSSLGLPWLTNLSDILIPNTIGGIIGGLACGVPMIFIMKGMTRANFFKAIDNIPLYCLRGCSAQSFKTILTQINSLSVGSMETLGNAFGHALIDSYSEYSSSIPPAPLQIPPPSTELPNLGNHPNSIFALPKNMPPTSTKQVPSPSSAFVLG
jgi:hypothetical protein